MWPRRGALGLIPRIGVGNSHYRFNLIWFDHGSIRVQSWGSIFYHNVHHTTILTCPFTFWILVGVWAKTKVAAVIADALQESSFGLIAGMLQEDVGVLEERQSCPLKGLLKKNRETGIGPFQRSSN